MLLLIMTSFILYNIEESHFEDVVDSYEVINDVIICIYIIHFPVIFLKHKFQLFSYDVRYK